MAKPTTPAQARVYTAFRRLGESDKFMSVDAFPRQWERAIYGNLKKNGGYTNAGRWLVSKLLVANGCEPTVAARVVAEISMYKADPATLLKITRHEKQLKWDLASDQLWEKPFIYFDAISRTYKK